MTQQSYQATPEQWANAGAFASDTRACLLELRDRITLLEAAPLQPEPIDEAENDRRFRACLAAIDNAKPEQIRAATANSSVRLTNSNHPANPDSSSPLLIARKPLQQPSAATIAECGGPCEQGFWHCNCGLLEELNPDLRPKPPTPVTGLVERVAGTIINGVACDHIEERTARALLLLIADEVERRGDQGLDLDPGETSDWLRREAQSTSQKDYKA